jgi:hypothetical protein
MSKEDYNLWQMRAGRQRVFPATRLSTSWARRAFLAGRIERIIYRKRQVTIVGAVPLPSMDGDEVKKATFRIAGEIDIEAVKSRPRPTKPGDGRFRAWNPKYARASPAVSPTWRPALVTGAEAALTL